jgi:hypothetical protein
MGFIVRLYDKCVLAPVGDTRCQLALIVRRRRNVHTFTYEGVLFNFKGSAPLALPNVTVSRLLLFSVRVTCDSGAVESEKSPRGHCGVLLAVVASSVVYVAHC